MEKERVVIDPDTGSVIYERVLSRRAYFTEGIQKALLNESNAEFTAFTPPISNSFMGSAHLSMIGDDTTLCVRVEALNFNCPFTLNMDSGMLYPDFTKPNNGEIDGSSINPMTENQKLMFAFEKTEFVNEPWLLIPISSTTMANAMLICVKPTDKEDELSLSLLPVPNVFSAKETYGRICFEFPQFSNEYNSMEEYCSKMIERFMLASWNSDLLPPLDAIKQTFAWDPETLEQVKTVVAETSYEISDEVLEHMKATNPKEYKLIEQLATYSKQHPRS